MLNLSRAGAGIRRFPLLALIAAALLPAAWADVPAATKAPTISYYGVYLGKGKLGSATIERDPNATWGSKPAVRTETKMRMSIHIEGASSGDIITTEVSWNDPKTGKPLAASSRTEASGRITTVDTVYGDHDLTYTANIQGSQKKGVLTLAAGQHFLTDPTDGVEVKPTVGMKFTGEIFIPDLFKIIDAEVKVADKETVTIGGLAVSAYRIVDHNAMEDSTLFADEDGELLRIDNSVAGIPMQIVKEAKDIALAPPGANATPDLAILTSIRPTGEPLEQSARTTDGITYQISGFENNLAASDSVQDVSYAPDDTPGAAKGARVATVTVHSTPLPSGPTVPLFARPEDAPTSLQPYLQSTLYVPATDPMFQGLAKMVVGKETDSARAAAKIAAYVHRTVKADPSIAALRTAVDIEKDPRGVCRDYTTLFTAIARAAGLPTKQCVGVGYVGGVFGIHAWPEVWVGKNPATGEDHWVALEPTWGMPFADATHIKLVEGEITDLFSVASDLGKYRIQVMHVD